jgi:hypothetical protein
MSGFITPAAIKGVPRTVKFDIRALKPRAASSAVNPDRLEV